MSLFKRARRSEEAVAEEVAPGIFRPAVLDEYITWLRGYVVSGGELTHSYDYPWGGCLVASQDFRLGDECGSNARSIIVESGVTYLGGGLGHNNLYFMDEFRYEGVGTFVPIFSDPVFQSIPGAEERKRIDDAEREKFHQEIQASEWRRRGLAIDSDLSQYVARGRRL